jgi:hypothetical protein
MGGKVVLRSRCRSQNPNARRRRIEMTSKVGTSDVSPSFSSTKRSRKGDGMTYKELPIHPLRSHFLSN